MLRSIELKTESPVEYYWEKYGVFWNGMANGKRKLISGWWEAYWKKLLMFVDIVAFVHAWFCMFELRGDHWLLVVSSSIRCWWWLLEETCLCWHLGLLNDAHWANFQSCGRRINCGKPFLGEFSGRSREVACRGVLWSGDCVGVSIVGSAVLKEFFEGILYHHKRNHKQLSRGVGVWGRSFWKICLAFKVP